MVPGTGSPKYTKLNIWAPSRAMALGSRRRSRSLLINFVPVTKFILALPKEELRFAGGARKCRTKAVSGIQYLSVVQPDSMQITHQFEMLV